MIVEVAWASELEEAWAKTMDVAGRQRMLSQKMSKEFLLIAKDIDVVSNQQSMQKSIGLQ